MYKINTNITKKSIKHIMVISAIATLMLAYMGSIPIMKSYAFSGLDLLNSKSDGNNNGSIETGGLLSCFGVGVHCKNTNTDNNNPETGGNTNETDSDVTNN